MNENTLYSVWLQKALGYASEKLYAILSSYATLKDFYKSSYEQKLKSRMFNERQLMALCDVKLNDAEKILKQCQKLNIDVIDFESENYPAQFKDIYNPPAVIYTKGKKLRLDNKNLLSIVGSRKATEYGCDVAFRFAYELSKSKVTIVSGGANGIDTMALKGALKAESADVLCVVATGLDICYPKANDVLYEIIEKHGTMISEFPPGVEPLPGYFPVRNRLISGISKAVLVVEAAIKSGAIITANLALDQGREVFAVPGNINSQSSKGTNLLIKDGATPVTEIDDILKIYGAENSNEKSIFLSDERINFEEIYLDKSKIIDMSNKIKEEIRQAQERGPSLQTVSQSARKLYASMTKQPKSIDELAKITQINIINAQTAAMELLLGDFVYTDENGKYYK